MTVHNRPTAPRRRRGAVARDRGAAAVEAALVIPLLLLVVFGIIDFGRMLNAQLKVTEAAREGTRARAVGAASAQPRISMAMGGMDGVVFTNGPSCPPNAGPNADATVTVTYRFEFVTPVSLLGISGPINLSATGVMPCYG